MKVLRRYVALAVYAVILLLVLILMQSLCWKVTRLPLPPAHSRYLPPDRQRGGDSSAYASQPGHEVGPSLVHNLTPTQGQLFTREPQKPPAFIPDKPDMSPVRQPASIPTRFMIEEVDYCQRRPGLQVITYVHSAILHVKQRDNIRATWANASAYDLGDISVKVGVVFMVGRVQNDLERQIVQRESQRYHDIVQGDYGDHYRLLTYKGLASLYWINKHCSHVPWTLHADDDTHIDIFLFYRALQELDDDHSHRFVCFQLTGGPQRSGKWNVSYEEYPANIYPPYCAGAMWFLQTKLIPRLLKASEVVPFLWVDDTYITGLLAKEAGIKRLKFNRYFDFRGNNPRSIGKKVVWISQVIPSRVWWKKIISYHRKHSMHISPTLLSKRG
ncbi:beta-1,3-galactosyltransferase 1-like isoform X2 [Procambarus clarkii]|uniref:beta-1,3-galactosyltransferase 1-like isoform X2 n=1 Tax=Procambarus clarkii TaxID=6728 RepID=UPI0037439F8F